MDAGYIFQKKTYDGPVHLLELEAGAAGSLHRVGAVMVWLRREDESRHFNSYISSSLPSHHFAVNVCLTEQAAQRGGNKCTSPSTPPFIKNVILKQMGGEAVNMHTLSVSALILKPQEQHKLCDPGTESEPFTA